MRGQGPLVGRFFVLGGCDKPVDGVAEFVVWGGIFNAVIFDYAHVVGREDSSFAFLIGTYPPARFVQFIDLEPVIFQKGEVCLLCTLEGVHGLDKQKNTSIGIIGYCRFGGGLVEQRIVRHAALTYVS